MKNKIKNILDFKIIIFMKDIIKIKNIINIRTIYKMIISFIMFLYLSNASFGVVDEDDFGSFGERLLNVGPVYHGCIFGSEKEDPNYKTFLVRPIGEQCYTKCQETCMDQYSLYEDPTPTGENYDPQQYNTQLQDTISINKDLIGMCLKKCANGEGAFNQKRELKSSGDIIKDVTDNIANSTVIVKDSLKLLDTFKNGYCVKNNMGDELSPYYPYQYEEVISKGDVMNLVVVSKVETGQQDKDILSLNNTPNTVYLCGYDTRYIYPQYYTTDSFFTKNGIVKYDSKKDPWRDIVFAPEAMSNKAGMDPTKVWHAKSGSWYNTGIIARNGDSLSITTYGRYMSVCVDGSQPCKAAPGADNALQVKKASDSSSLNPWSTGGVSGDVKILSTDGLKLSIEDKKINEKDTKGLLEQARKDSESNEKFYQGLGGEYVLGLKPSVTFNTDIKAFYKNKQLDYDKVGYKHDYNDSGYRSQTFQGNLKDFSDKFSFIGIRHFDTIGGYVLSHDNNKFYNHQDWYTANDYQFGPWADNVGGLNVEISWKGCRFENGERTQYIVIPLVKMDDDRYLKEKFQNDDNWKDFNFSNTAGESLHLGNFKFTPDGSWLKDSKTEDPETTGQFLPEKKDPNIGKGYVFFRIKPLDFSKEKGAAKKMVRDGGCSNLNTYDKNICFAESSLNDKSFSPAFTSGFYNFIAKIDKAPEENTNSKCGIIGGTILNFYRELFGNPDASDESLKQGITQRVYKYILADRNIVNIIHALMLLYVTMMGLGFLMGMMPINQKEGITRVFKLGIVAVLLSDQSWTFFNTYLLVAFTEGTQGLISLFTYYDGNIAPCTEMKWMPALGLFDDLMNRLGSSLLWKRMLSLLSALVPFGNGNMNMANSSIGVILFISILFAGIACLRVFLVYLVSILGIAILFLLAPIFISFILFASTKELFNAWLKQLIVFVMEPIMVFGAVSLLASIILILFDVTMSFTVCRDCLFSFMVKGFKICIAHKYIPIFSAHTPNVFFTPMLMVTSALTCLIVGHAMYVICDIAAALASRIISFAAATATGMGGYLALMKPAIQGIEMQKTAVGGTLAAVLRIDDYSNKDKEKEALDEANKFNEGLSLNDSEKDKDNFPKT